MASANPLPLAQSSIPSAPSFWSRESAALKQGIKTGLAGTIAYAIYAGFHLHQGYWAVFAALVVTQANLGAAWKAAFYRTIGSACGAIAAALLIPVLGDGPIGAGIVLFILASFFAYLTVLHPAFTAAGFTAAFILVFGGQGEPWHLAWLRVIFTIEGALVAFVVGVLIWPVRALVTLRMKIASIIDGSGALYRAVTAAAIEGIENENEVRNLDRKLHDLRRGISQQMDEAHSEIAFSRFNQSAYRQLVDLGDQLRRRLTGMAEDRSLYIHAHLEPGLLPSLPVLAGLTANSFSSLAESLRGNDQVFDATSLESAIRGLDADLARLRALRTTAPFALDRMLPFWALVFNLREIAEDLLRVNSLLPTLK